MGPCLPTPAGLGSLSLAFAALRLRQSVGLCGHPTRVAGLTPPFVSSTLLGVCRGGLGLQDWNQGLSSWAFWDSSGFLFCFCWDRTIFSGSRSLFQGPPCVATILRGMSVGGRSHLNMRVGWVVSPGRTSLRVLFLFYEGNLGTQRKLSCPILAVGGFWYFHLFQNLPSPNEGGCRYSHLPQSLPSGAGLGALGHPPRFFQLPLLFGHRNEMP